MFENGLDQLDGFELTYLKGGLLQADDGLLGAYVEAGDARTRRCPLVCALVFDFVSQTDEARARWVQVFAVAPQSAELRFPQTHSPGANEHAVSPSRAPDLLSR